PRDLRRFEDRRSCSFVHGLLCLSFCLIRCSGGRRCGGQRRAQLGERGQYARTAVGASVTACDALLGDGEDGGERVVTNRDRGRVPWAGGRGSGPGGAPTGPPACPTGRALRA